MGICIECGGQGSWYGLAPHSHNMEKTGSIIGSTEIYSKDKWPANFTEDAEAPGCGVWTCEKCGGSGESGLETPYEQYECDHHRTDKEKTRCLDCGAVYDEKNLTWK